MSEIPNELFELDTITDDPRFEGFGIVDAPSALGRESLYEDMSPWFESGDNYRWPAISLRSTWVAPRVQGRVAPYNDYPALRFIFPAFSERACQALEAFLKPNGELLPLVADNGQKYFFYNITTISDALDRKKSDCEWFDPPTTAVDIDHFVFDKKKLKGLSIFRIYEWPMGAIVTDEFVRRVHECGLNGFNFIKIWPVPQGVNWRLAEAAIWRKDTARKNLKPQTLVLRLPLQGSKPNAAEKKAIKKLEDDLDAQLVVQSLNSTYFGSYEGGEPVDGEFRLFLSCPDADRLEQKLLPWLRMLDWKEDVQILKRRGGMYDKDAPESTTQIKKQPR